MTKVTLTLAMVGALIASLLLAWRQVKKFRVHTVENIIRKLEQELNEIEDRMADSDSDTSIANWDGLHRNRASIHRRLRELRHSIAEA